jgi:hypothetical protein
MGDDLPRRETLTILKRKRNLTLAWSAQFKRVSEKNSAGERD